MKYSTKVKEKVFSDINYEVKERGRVLAMV